MDALETGLGAMLLQVLEGEEHPVLSISCTLLPVEKNYAAVEREALIIKWTVTEQRYYLIGHHITLVIDDAPIQWMVATKDTNTC